MSLTAAERIMMHLSDHWRSTEPVPELTQKGIAAGTDVRRSHVPRNLKKLIAEGYVGEAVGRISGSGRKVRFYRITEAGIRRAKELREALQSEKVMYGGKEHTIAETSKVFGLTPLVVKLRTDNSGVFRPPSSEAQAPSGLIERDEDVMHLKKWHRQGGPVMVVYGSTGIGKTALGKAYVSQYRGRSVWITLHDGEDLAMLLLDLQQALRIPAVVAEHGKHVLEQIANREVLVVLDDYHQLSEDVVDFLAEAISTLRGGSGKILVLAQETTPSYCRFYGRDTVLKGDVWEHHLRGLSMQGCRKMLGTERIDEEALKRIYLLTKGIPLYLDLMRRGEVDELKKKSRFTSAEVKLLMFSKDVSPRG